MIESLHIENIAVVKSLDIELGRGLTVLSGETGAGKSIIIDSLGLLLGGRADRELIRSGEESATVSAVFGDISDSAAELIAEMGFDVSDRCVMISRTVGRNSSSARFCGRAITLSMLREIAGRLFSIHGQNDSMQILDPKTHMVILDSFAGCEKLLSDYSEKYKQMLHIKCEMDSISRDAMERNRLGEMLRFQIADIDSVKLKAGEEEQLEELCLKLRSAEKIEKSCNLAAKAMKGGEKGMGAIYLTEKAASALDAISDVVPDAGELAERLNNVKYELYDIAESISGLSDIGDGDVTARLDKAEGRLDAISKLKRKYGSSVEEILEYRRDAEKRLKDMENSEDRIEELRDELRAIEAKALKIAEALHERRVEAAAGLTAGVTENLAFLDMPKVRFETKVAPLGEFGPYGRDKVEFMIATNPGEPLAPMAKIASGGELARIMLSLKNILNKCDGVDTVIFDEIDTGISGKTSRKVGIKLKEIGRESQVICVTHSAQIASLANNHLYISKRVTEDDRVESEVRPLADEERVEEIARILGGIEITEVQRDAAREMIAEGERY